MNVLRRDVVRALVVVEHCQDDLASHARHDPAKDTFVDRQSAGRAAGFVAADATADGIQCPT
jgi:hypothetical protein